MSKWLFVQLSMGNNNSSSTFRAFQNRNYALFFAGQSISQIGTWMQRTAVIWVIYSLTHSASMIGVSVFAQQFPSFLLSLFGGVVSDRYDRYKILLVTQTASMIQAILLAALILTNHYIIWEILSLSVVLGIINAFDVPARQPMIMEMIENKEDLANAISLNSAMVNIARMVGPALSGIILQKFGAGICFSLNAISFIAVITSLLLMTFPKFTPPSVKKKVSSELAEGFRYIRDTPTISIIILVLVSLSLFVLPYDTTEPIFAKIVYKGNATTYGYISSCVGLGAILGSLILASLKKGTDLKGILIGSIVILGAGLILFSRVSYLPFALPSAVIIGLGSLTPMSTCITIIQMESATHMRGRVMSYMALSFFGVLPIGSLLIGNVSQIIGAPLTMFCQGIIALVIALIFYRIFRKNKIAQKEGQPALAVEVLGSEKNN